MGIFFHHSILCLGNQVHPLYLYENSYSEIDKYLKIDALKIGIKRQAEMILPDSKSDRLLNCIFQRVSELMVCLLIIDDQLMSLHC